MLMVVEQIRERNDTERKGGGETDAELTISNISYQREKKNWWMKECLKCVTASAFVRGQCIPVQYTVSSLWMKKEKKTPSSECIKRLFFIALTLFKINVMLEEINRWDYPMRNIEILTSIGVCLSPINKRWRYTKGRISNMLLFFFFFSASSRTTSHRWLRVRREKDKLRKEQLL